MIYSSFKQIKTTCKYNFDEVEFDFDEELDDCLYLVKKFFLAGYLIDIKQAYTMWQSNSLDSCAGWLLMDRKDNSYGYSHIDYLRDYGYFIDENI